jgi:hypothetical protein
MQSMLKLFAVLLVVLVTPARAELVPCVTSVAGTELSLHYNPDDPRVAGNTTRREALLGDWRGITCPGFVTLRALTPELTDDERGSFCLTYDREARTYTGYAPGERDAYAICREPSKSFCERVEGSGRAALDLTRFAARGAQDAARLASDVSLLTQGNGAVLLSGSARDVATTLGKLGVSAVTTWFTPAQLGAAAVTVLAVGGVVYVCSG